MKKVTKITSKLSPHGRKYSLALLGFVLILIGFSLTHWSPFFIQTYAEFVGGIVGMFLVYCGGNVSSQLATNRQPTTVTTTTTNTKEGENA